MKIDPQKAVLRANIVKNRPKPSHLQVRSGRSSHFSGQIRSPMSEIYVQGKLPIKFGHFWRSRFRPVKRKSLPILSSGGPQNPGVGEKLNLTDDRESES